MGGRISFHIIAIGLPGSVVHSPLSGVLSEKEVFEEETGHMIIVICELIKDGASDRSVWWGRYHDKVLLLLVSKRFL